MALDLTQGSKFYLVVLTDREGNRRPVRIVSENERLTYMSSVNTSFHQTGVVASEEPIELSYTPSKKKARRRLAKV